MTADSTSNTEIQTSYHLLINNCSINKSNNTVTKINTRLLTLNLTTSEPLNSLQTYETKSQTWDIKTIMSNNNSSKCLQVAIQGNNTSSRISRRSQHQNSSTITRSKTRVHSSVASRWMTITLHSRDLLLPISNSEWNNSSNKIMRKNSNNSISSMLNSTTGLEAVGNINSNNNTTSNNRCSIRRDKSSFKMMSSPRN